MSRYLVDTHIMLWVFDDDQTLSSEARTALNTADIVYASHASVWEIVIKKALGKLEAPENLEQAIITTGFKQLPISLAHILAVGELSVEKHKDPFDRLLIAQAKIEGLTLISRDERFNLYGVPVIEA